MGYKTSLQNSEIFEGATFSQISRHGLQVVNGEKDKTLCGGRRAARGDPQWLPFLVFCFRLGSGGGKPVVSYGRAAIGLEIKELEFSRAQTIIMLHFQKCRI